MAKNQTVNGIQRAAKGVAQGKNLFLRMAKVILPALLCLSATQSAQAQSNAIQTPLLFSIEKEGHVSFIFGTRHGIFHSADLPHFVFDALSFANVLAVETLSFQREGVKVSERQISFPPGIRPTPFTQLKLLERGLTQEFIAQFDPGWLCLAYEGWEGLQDLNVNKTALDQELEAKGWQLHKQMHQLDDSSVSDQANINIHSCDINEFVQRKSPEQAREDFKNEGTIYQSGDLTRFKDESGSRDSQMAMVKERNLTWIEKIAEMHPRTAFLAFGADHLVGLTGMISLLNANGYTVNQVKTNAQFQKLKIKYHH